MERVAFLSDPGNYPEGTRGVEAIETHLSWVFLTDRHAYKMKKPQRFDHHELGTVEARGRHCRMEVRLNRRLSDDVYLGVVPLYAIAGGGFDFRDEGGEVAEWLVKMRRLDGELMLDRVLRAGTLHRRDLRSVVRLLADFYRTCAPEPVSGPELRARLAARTADNTRELGRFTPHLDARALDRLGDGLLAFIEDRADLFDRRVEEGRIVEGHGDLRPEHICLEVPPRIIDCLDVSRELRIVDPAEELGFLALEFERLGAASRAPWIFEEYAAASGDRPDARLVHFHQAFHAGSRAKLALWHLLDASPRDPARWPPLARGYLDLAARHLAAALDKER